MKYNIILLLLFPALLILCDNPDDIDNKDCLSGSGNTIEETRPTGDFIGITAGIAGNLYITQGLTNELRIVTHPNVMDELKTEVKSGILEIGFDRCTSGIDKLDIFVTFREIRSIIFSGAGNITGENDLNLAELTVVLSGAGNIILSGEVDKLDYTLSGAGDLKAFDLITSECIITITGLGNAEITATDELDILITGNGNVYYKGNPSITSNITGKGNIFDSN